MSAATIRPSQGCTVEEVAAAVAAISAYVKNGRPVATHASGRPALPVIPGVPSAPAAATGSAMEGPGTGRRPELHGRTGEHTPRTTGR